MNRSKDETTEKDISWEDDGLIIDNAVEKGTGEDSTDSDAYNSMEDTESEQDNMSSVEAVEDDDSSNKLNSFVSRVFIILGSTAIFVGIVFLLTFICRRYLNGD